MTSLFLSLHLIAHGVAEIDVNNTNPFHLYSIQTSTDLKTWTKSTIFFGNGSTVFFLDYTDLPQEFYRVQDLGSFL